MFVVLLCLCLQDADTGVVPSRELIVQLGSGDPEVREKATVALQKRGAVALIELEAAEKSSDLEISTRVRWIIKKIPSKIRYATHLALLDEDASGQQVVLGTYAALLDLHEEALSHFDRAGEIDPDLRESLEEPIETCVEGKLKEAETLIDKGDRDGGVKICRQVLDRYDEGPCAAKARVFLATVKALEFILKDKNGEQEAKRLYQAGDEMLIKRRDQAAAATLFRKALLYSHTDYMKKKNPPSNKTRIEIIKGLNRTIGR